MKTYKHPFVIIWLLAFACLASSCIRDNVDTLGGSEVTMRVAPFTRGAGNDDPDDTIEKFRIMIFRQGNGVRVADYDVFVDDLSQLAEPRVISIDMATGTYDFVFVANEDSAPAAVASALDAVRTLKELSGIVFPSSAFSESRNIPMSQIVRDVQVLGDGKYKIADGTEKDSPMSVMMERLGMRLDLRLITESTGKAAAFEKIEIHNVPAAVPLFAADAAGDAIYTAAAFEPVAPETEHRGYAVGDGFAIDNEEDSPNKGKLVWAQTRIILPSSVLKTPTAANCMKVVVKYGESSGFADESALLYNADMSGTPPAAYTIPRNRYYTVTGLMEQSGIEVHIAAAQWETATVSGNMFDKQLNVSAVEASINGYNMARIHFWSNQPEVFVDETGYTNLTGTTEFTVNESFYSLAGTDAANFHYDPQTGNGYIDIITDRSLLASASHTRRIYLNAGGLRREITVTADLTNSPIVQWATMPYIGAFWRHSETGERLIGGGNSGGWSAEVLDGADWVVLQAGKSLDAGVWTSNPGPANAENHQVEGGSSSIEGTGNIGFRIGLSSTIGPDDHRYARVKVKYNDKASESILYLRQGEAVDYLMRPGDKDKDGNNVGGNNRRLAARFSPYNLTHPTFKDPANSATEKVLAPVQPDNANDYFTDYPTQPGALYQWAQTNGAYAFRPVGSVTMPIDTNETDCWNAIKDGNETCPKGYRRPSDGSTEEFTDLSGEPDATNSEIGQSLWLNPKNGSSTSPHYNSVIGYYADGYFDRHMICTTIGLPNIMFGSDDLAVNAGLLSVAYCGALYYNPVSAASIFFPAPGYRLAVNYLYMPGYYGHYLTSSSAEERFGWSFNFNIEGANYRHSSNRNTAYSIRCVKDEEPEPPYAETTSTTFIPYVGAFWRADQRGERLIFIPRMTNKAMDGAWTATVTDGSGWIRLDTKATTDKGVTYNTSTENPHGMYKAEHDRDHLVKDNVSTVSGTVGDGSTIYFRIGLTGEYTPTENAPARYGKIRVTYANGSKSFDMYVRQGHDPDYLFRNDTAADAYEGAEGTTLRTLSVPFSPYNLTHPTFKDPANYATQEVLAPVQPADGPDKYFTDYPSQAGAFYQWAHTNGAYAFSPVSPKDNTAPPHFGTSNTVTAYWNAIKDSYETCPKDYRRPTNGSATNEVAVPFFGDGIPNADNSEMGQSLWENPPVGGTNNVENSIWGYYADGFFDRRAVGEQDANSNAKDNAAVNTDMPTVAYRGQLFFNPATSASLFFPAPGSRTTDGYLSNTGGAGQYWSSSASDSSGGYGLYIFLDIYNVVYVRHTSFVHRRYGQPIRCVVDK